MRKKNPINIPYPNIARYNPSVEHGLTSRQVQGNTEAGLINVTSDKASKTAGQIVCSNLFTYFNLIFFLLAGVLVYEGSYNNLTFLGVVFANTIVGIVQELKAKRVLDKLQLVAAPESIVIRDGKEIRLPSEELVLDDIVLLTAGNQVCADCVVCDGELTVNESLVTGEADEIKKAVGDTLLSGSFVVSGKAYVRLDKVGDDSFAAQLSVGTKQIKKRQQPGMMRSLTCLIQIIGVIIIPFAAMMFWNQYHVIGLTERVSVENTAAAIIGMIPEGLYLLTSVALMASTIRLAKQNTLVHDMKCIETLARVDVICVDKTGTITQPQMEVRKIIPLYPLKPAQISLASVMMIGIPSFFLALEPNTDLVHGKFLRNVLFRALPAALTSVILVEWSLLFADAFQIPTELASTVAFFLYAIAAYLMLFRVCKPMTAWHGILFGAMGALFLAAVFLIPEWFHIVPLNYGCALILSALLLLSFPIDHTLQRAFLWLESCMPGGKRVINGSDRKENPHA